MSETNQNQWEVVVKSKKQRNLDMKVEAHVEKKRLEKITPKLEEILPTKQYHDLISGKENFSPSKQTALKASLAATEKKQEKKNVTTKNKEKEKQLESKKQQQKQQQQQQQHQQQQQQATKAAAKPKSLEAAIRNITPADFNAQLEQLKLSFPGSELLWLKGIASYLNTSLSFDCDPTFSGKSIHYPTNLATTELKQTITEFLKSVGEPNLSYFYHTLLLSMTMELSKNLPIVGYKFILQLIGQNWPNICADNMAKTAMLRNSYVNRSNVCLTILWAIGQGGYQSLENGIKVWQNLMWPSIELKSYSKFVTEYAERLLNLAVDQSLNFNQNEFFTTFNAMRQKYNGLTREQQDALTRSADLFLQKYIARTSNNANIFLSLFRDIDNEHNHVELNGCLSCLKNGDSACKVWKMNYKKRVIQSILLLKRIEQDLKDDDSILNIKSFQNFLVEAQTLNNELDADKRRDPNLDTLISLVTNVLEKTAQKKKQNTDQKKKCGCCKWILGSFLLIGLIGGIIAYDTHVNGKGVFEKSAVGKVLKEYGALPYVEKGWYTTMGAGARGYKWSEKNVPVYAKPVITLICDLYKVTRNAVYTACGVVHQYWNGTLPIVADFLDSYLPGSSKKIGDTVTTMQLFVVDVYGKVHGFLKTEVFVGKLSPENLNKVLNDTVNLAQDYYKIFNKKVDVYAKLK